MPEPGFESGPDTGRDTGPRPGIDASLRGCRVLVARPARQAATLCSLIEAAGGKAFSLPLLEIAPVADPAAAAAQLSRGCDARHWIFSSSNAVRYAAALVEQPWPPVAAVGDATAAALASLGIAEVLVPVAGDGAAALLAHPLLAQVQAQRIMLISGEQPLPELETRLRERGARVEMVAVYRRLPVAHSPEAVALAVMQADVAIVPSGEALEQLVRITPSSAQASLLALQLALPSLRVVEKARELGFRRTPLLPQRVSDAAYVDVLRRSTQSPGEQDRQN